MQLRQNLGLHIIRKKSLYNARPRCFSFFARKMYNPRPRKYNELPANDLSTKEDTTDMKPL